MAEKTNSIAVMSALAVEVAFKRFILPDFEKTSGQTIDMIWDPTAVLMRRIAAGERADVIVAIDDSMDKLAEQGVIRSETRVAIAQSVLGIAVKAGAPHPDISTTEAFKHALIQASAVAYSQGGASGIYFAGLIERIGIAEAVKAKAVTIPAGFTAEKLVSGEAELAVQQISELMSVAGIEVIGPFPADVQATTNLSVAIFTDAKNPQGAAAFIEALSSVDAALAYGRGGLVSRLRAAA